MYHRFSFIKTSESDNGLLVLCLEGAKRTEDKIIINLKYPVCSRNFLFNTSKNLPRDLEHVQFLSFVTWHIFEKQWKIAIYSDNQQIQRYT